MFVCEYKCTCGGVCPLSSFTTLCLFLLTGAPSLNLGHFYLLGGYARMLSDSLVSDSMELESSYGADSWAVKWMLASKL